MFPNVFQVFWQDSSSPSHKTQSGTSVCEQKPHRGCPPHTGGAREALKLSQRCVMLWSCFTLDGRVPARLGRVQMTDWECSGWVGVVSSMPRAGLSSGVLRTSLGKEYSDEFPLGVLSYLNLSLE